MKVLHALDFEPGQDLSLRSVARADHCSRIQAADVLMKNGNQRSVDGIKNAYARETRWGLRGPMRERWVRLAPSRPWSCL